MIARLRRQLLLPAGTVVLALLVGAVALVASSPLVKGYVDLGLPLATYAALVQGSILSINGLVDTIVTCEGERHDSDPHAKQRRFGDQPLDRCDHDHPDQY